MPHSRRNPNKRRRVTLESPVPSRGPLTEPDHELRGLVSGHHIPPPVLRRIEARFASLKNEISERGRERGKLDAALSEERERAEGERRRAEKVVRRAKEDAAIRVRADALRITRLEADRENLREALSQRDQLLDAGTLAVRTLRAENEVLRGEVAQKDGLVMEKERRIRALDEVVLQMEGASGDELVGLALEAQAQRSLVMLDGLKGELVERDAKIGELWAAMHAQRMVQFKLQEELLRRTEVLEGEKEQLETKYQGWKREFKTVGMTMSDMDELLEQQQRLIERLIKENGRLQGLGGRVASMDEEGT